MKTPLLAFLLGGTLLSSSCSDHSNEGFIPTPLPEVDSTFLNDLQRSHFNYFWELAAPSGLIPDRASETNQNAMYSIAATGFGLSVYIVGVERGFITRSEAAQRTLTTLQTLANSPQGPASSGTIGYKGFFYHFLNNSTGLREGTSELSTVDTGLLMAGALCSASYFNGTDATETEIRRLADTLYRSVDWQWALNGGSLLSMGWTPENGFLPYTWQGYNEAMILYLLAIGAPDANQSLRGSAWTAWTATYRYASFEGYEMVNFSPLFGHQYSHIWVDFANIKDAYMRARSGLDYFENSRRATLANRAYCISNPSGYPDYGTTLWGLTACDGPNEGGAWGYYARGASAEGIADDGTLAPTAAGGSMPFTPQESYATLQAMRNYRGGLLYTRYGFRDSFNPSLGWIDPWWIGIDQGPIVLMIENYRSGLLWKIMKGNSYLVAGLREAGFIGGWLNTQTVQ